ncbi:hypothetical protein BKP45_10210 [Anaerobacillus alkalidiazotrophicus]|uniref:Uncharacterized protein n=2 Tax=Anaerobacillus alkalidiazotrophicus TaxID=472963 RepID=A0A1S2M6R5_9BACI|nr:hypothetical protein BKP45_10210 [Anaerobacillus alkalidiazotrophicus]
MFLIIMLILVGFFGYRFTALSAAKSNTFVSNSSVLIEEWDTGSSSLFLFKDDKEETYRIALSEKLGFLYRSRASTYVPYSDDDIKTMGGMSYRTGNEEFTLLVIESNVNEVAYIEAGRELEREKQKINQGERISFLFPYNKQIDHLNALALNEDGEELYYYGYPENKNHIDLNEDLRWHKIEQSNSK